MAHRTATWNESDYASAGTEQFARDEEIVRRGFWKKARKFAARLPFAEDLLAAWYCAFDRDTPMQVKAALIGALAYFVLPFDAVPDVLPFLGFLWLVRSPIRGLRSLDSYSAECLVDS